MNTTEWKTIVVTLPVDCPVGYRPVAVRGPKSGELFANAANAQGVVEAVAVLQTAPRLIVEAEVEEKPSWTPPAWFPRNVYLCQLPDLTWSTYRRRAHEMLCDDLAWILCETFNGPTAGKLWYVDAAGNATLLE